MPKLRISVVQYLNTSPLVWGFTHGPLAGKYDLSFTVPSQCAEALRSGEVDIAIIPAIEYQRIDNLVILPDLAIASKRRVRSLLLISKVPLSSAASGAAQSRELHARKPQKSAPRSIALDRSSRSTQALTKILCARHWQIAPQFREMPPDLATMLADNDAALIIGDPALRISLAIESALRSAGIPAGGFEARSKSTHSPSAQSNLPQSMPDHVSALLSENLPPAKNSALEPAAPEITTTSTLGLPGNETLYVYDIVEQWRCMTNLSAVLAVWAARPSVATPEVVADFHASRAFGLLHLPELCAAASTELRLPAPALYSYLTDNIDFTLDPENISGLSEYFAQAASLNLIPAAKPVLLAPGPKPIPLDPAPIANLRGSLNGRALDILSEERKHNRGL